MITISVYATGDRESPSYYRIWQYVDKLNDVRILSHTKYAKFLIKKYNPIGLQPVYIKIIAWVCMCVKLGYSLCADIFFYKPKIVFVQRCFAKKRMPKIFRLLIDILVKKGTRIIWDFDDNILASKELNQSDFNFHARKSWRILVTHDYLKQLISKEFQEKVRLLRTTDGDMYKSFEEKCDMITKDRLVSLKKQVNLVWVATKGNIPYLKRIIPMLDCAAKKIVETDGRMVFLKVVCNGQIEDKTEYLCIQNIIWTRNRAIQEMMESHIGIMPLTDSDFAKGKGSFKLVQYMSVGLPCIASSVGFNCDVIDDSFGYLTNSDNEWIDALIEQSDINSWERKSESAYDHWKKNFSFEKNFEIIKELLV